MFMSNTKIKWTDDHEGSVSKAFQKMSIIEENDGTRSFEDNRELMLTVILVILDLVYHWTFAMSTHRINSRNYSHWNSPNKQYLIAQGDDDNFNIFFT